MFIKIFFFIFLIIYYVETINHHQQIHLSLGKNYNEMIVTWITKKNDYLVRLTYGLENSPFSMTVRARTVKFLNSGKEKRIIYIHRAVMKNLEPDKVYKYRIISTQNLSPVYTFLSRRVDNKNLTTSFIMFADMGLNGTILPKLIQDVKRNRYDAVFHVGDIAYNLNNKNGRVGDKFMNEIEPIASRIAYQVAVGNHEKKSNFSNYLNRFTMINEDSNRINNHYYSFNLNNIHFIIYSTEFYYFTEFGTEQIQAQYNWLLDDLKKANQPENRASRPWIIAMAHRSMYCIGFDLKDCVNYERIFRKDAEFSLENLFNKYKVDLHLAGHEHAYAKFFPVFDKNIFPLNVYSTPTNYVNPPSMINIISGSASNKPEDFDFDFENDNYKKPKWVSKWILEPSYTRIKVFNDTTLLIQQVSSNLNERILDELKINKMLYRSH